MADLTKKDAKALWWAIDWSSTVLREWRREGFKDDAERDQYDHQIERLQHAKYALRKVRAGIRATASAAHSNGKGGEA